MMNLIWLYECREDQEICWQDEPLPRPSPLIKLAKRGKDLQDNPKKPSLSLNDCTKSLGNKDQYLRAERLTYFKIPEIVNSWKVVERPLPPVVDPAGAAAAVPPPAGEAPPPAAPKIWVVKVHRQQEHRRLELEETAPNSLREIAEELTKTSKAAARDEGLYPLFIPTLVRQKFLHILFYESSESYFLFLRTETPTRKSRSLNPICGSINYAARPPPAPVHFILCFASSCEEATWSGCKRFSNATTISKAKRSPFLFGM